jgi:hypothetical protein
VAVGDDGAILGSATWGRNHGGGASHIASASFMVDPAHYPACGTSRTGP